MPTSSLTEGDGIDKAATGIEGFDEITRGGIPQGRTTVVMGTPGSGKTVFALQTLVNGARYWAEPAIFVAFEEQSRQLRRNAATFGWDLQSLEQESLFFLDARKYPALEQAGNFDLVGLLAGLEAKAQGMGAKRIVFDSIDVLLERLGDPLAKRDELYRIHDWLARTGLTGIITARNEGPEPFLAHEYGFLQFMADCVVALHHRIFERVSARGIRVIKYRGSQFSENEFPMTISTTGIDVATTPFETAYQVFKDRISTGVERLDTMLSGGYLRGSSILVTGSPGTAKSTLAASLIEATCKRGERALYVSFDEGAEEMIRNMSSVGIDLASHIESGLLHIYGAVTESKSAEEHLISLRTLIRQHQPQCMAVDPLSAMLKAGGALSALGIAQRLMHQTKVAGISLLCTSLLDSADSSAESSPIQVSTIADTWIHVSYMVQAGERNRALTIIKSRGTQHSNQVRELILSPEGITLANAYVAGGEVLMGTLRYEKEMEEKRKRENALADIEAQRREFEQSDTELSAQIEGLQMEREARRDILEATLRLVEAREAELTTQQVNLRRLRGVDIPSDNGGPHDAHASEA